jgi:hypothetical protein
MPWPILTVLESLKILVVFETHLEMLNESFCCHAYMYYVHLWNEYIQSYRCSPLTLKATLTFESMGSNRFWGFFW